MLLNASYITILNTAIADVTSVLTTFAADSLFAEKLALAFGKTVSSEKFLQAVAVLPQIEVRSDADLKGALGAFSAQTQKIYLSESLLKGDSARLRSVLIEEIGHFVDAQVNGVDSPGDEGAIFAAVVLGQELSSSQLAQLKAENDHGIINLNGQNVAVEKATTNEPYLVADINQNSFGSSPSNFIKVGGVLYFTATDDINGTELWKADPTTGVVSLLEINPGSGSSNISNLTDVNGTLYFRASDNTNGTELWKVGSNGTPTRIDLGSGASNPTNLINLNGTLYFTARGYNGTTSVGQELWRIDPTTGNPVVIDIVSGSGSSSPSNLTNINGILYFQAYTPATGYELWKVDPANNLPALISDLYPGTGSSSPSNFINSGGTVYFTANNGANGWELFRLDPTTGSPVLLDIYVGANSSSPTVLIDVNGTLYFKADDGTTSTELWKIDPTTGTPVKLAVNYAYYLDSFTKVGNKLYFLNSSYNDDYTIYRPLYTIDSTTGNPVIVSGISSVQSLTNINGVLYFQAYSGTTGSELWKIDPTTGTPSVIDIVSGTGSSSPTNLTDVNATLFFQATNSVNGQELWKLDSTGNPVLVKDIRTGTTGSSPSNLFNVNGTLYFTADNGINGVELWKSDGTTAGTVLAKDINGRNPGSDPTGLIDVNGTLYFRANDGINGTQLWKIDPTTGTPVRLVVPNLYGNNVDYLDSFTKVGNQLYFRNSYYNNDFTIYRPLYTIDSATGNPVMVEGISSVNSLTNINGVLYFQASSGTTGTELWKIDPTTGTPSVIDIVLGTRSSSPTNFTDVNGTLFFTASNSANGQELWKLDGTGNPVLVKDIRTGTTGSSPSNLFNVNGTLYFTADNGINGVELWKSNGTTAGTVQLEIYAGANGSNAANFISVGGVLYFTANNATSGTELWRINTTTGNPEVLEIQSGRRSSSPTYLTNINGTLYFQAYDTTYGYELWKVGTNGTPTRIDLGSGNSSPNYLTNVNGTLYFTATGFNGATYVGRELWQIDPTTGTPSVIDIVSGRDSSYPSSLINANGVLYFVADNSTNGNELWKVDPTTRTPIFLKDIYAGSNSSSPGNLTYSNGKLYFTADNGTQGVELWAVNVDVITTVGNITKNSNEDQTVSFTATDFSSVFVSGSGSPLAKVKILLLPSNGVLKLGTNAVTPNQEISVTNLGSLTFVPNANFNGTASFTWNGSDGTTFATDPSTVTLTINSINDVPTVANPIADVNIYSDRASNFGFSANTFQDADLEDTLSYSATLADGSPLPSWLSLNGDRAFSSNPGSANAGEYEIKVTAKDQSNATVTDNFILKVLNSAPTNIYLSNNTIPENSANDTPIATLSSQDNNTNNTHTYTLLNDAGGRFKLNGNQLVVANTSLLDYEAATQHTIRIKTTDNTGLTYERDLVIYLSNVNDSFAGTLSFTSPTFSVNENGNAIAAVTIQRTGGSEGTVSASITLSNGTATYPNDYSTTSVNVFFSNGETSKTVTMPIFDDNLFEGDETLNLMLVNPTGGSNLGTQTTAVLTIVDSDNVPDLIVSNITAPVEVISGQPLEISWTVKNQGVNVATGTWYDYVYLQNQNGGQNYNIGTFEFVGSLAVGESVNRSQTITLPIQLQGNYKVVVTTDSSNSIREEIQNESNNTTTDDRLLQVKLAPIPNLQVASVTAPLTAFSSQSTAIQWTVKNVGNGATSSPYWSDSVYLSLDNIFDNTDIYLGQANNPSYLNAGDSYNNNLDVTLPRGISGNYYFLVKTDVNNNVFENDKENDNLTVGGPTNVSLTPPPDFQVTNVTTPSQAFSGQSLNLNWTVSNKGLGKNLETVWYDQVFLSTDEVLDAGDRNLGTFSQNGILNSNDSYTSSQTVSLPIGISGDYYFFVQTDARNQVYENIFESNNTGHKATPTRINLTPPPDLEIVSLTAPTQATASRALNFSYRVTNFGSTSTPNAYWTDRFYLSVDNQLDPNTDLRIGDQPYYWSLAPDHSYGGSFSYILPNTLTGNYYLFGITDSNNEVFELNNDNNTFLVATPIAITSQPADLVVVSASAPTKGEAGKAVRVEWTVRNQGTGDTAVSGWTDRVILSKDAQVGNSDDIVLGSFSRVGILAPNQSYTRSELVTLPVDAIAGYQIFVVTDAGNSVYETTQENNNSSTGQPLTVTGGTADLQVTQVSSPNSAQSGQTLTVNWTVKNLGDNRTNSNYWYDGVYLSTDSQISSDDILLGNNFRSGTLDPSSEYSVTRNFNLPSNLQGNYYTIVRTDAYNNVFEGSLENNNDKTSGQNGNTGRTTISLTETPDLVIDSVDAPATSISGQNLSINWTVRNTGTVGTGQLSWYEAFYLSRDQVFGNSDTYLGYSYYGGNLAAGGTYSKTASFRIPQGLSGPLYLFAVTDAGNSVYERTGENNNVSYDLNSVAITLSQPADLVIGAITIPTTGAAGRNASITYTVTNQGANPVQGNWADSLYLSKDDQWDIGDAYLGQVQNSSELASGSSYTKTLTASLPGFVPGDYRVIVRSDIRNQISESNESNNLKVTLDQVNIDIERLTLGTPTTGTLGQGQAVYYRFDVGAGETLRLKLDSASIDSASTTTANELYLRYGEVPTRTQFDVGFSQPLSPDQDVVVPFTQAGTYYVLAYGQTVTDPLPSFSIEAKLLDFEIRSLSTKTGGNAGKITVEISGSKFDTGTTFTLTNEGLGVEIIASRLDLIDSTKLFATFDLKGGKAGVYNLVAKNAKNQTTTLQNSFTVVEGGKANLVTNIIAPSSVRPDVVIPITIQFANDGNIDLDSPLVLLASETKAPISLTREELRNQTNLEFVLQAENNPFGVLAPGAIGSITFYAKALNSLDSLDFSLSVLDNPTTSLNWNSYIKTIESQSPELFSDPTFTENFWNIFRASVGQTVGELQANLSETQQLLLSSLQNEAQSLGTTLSKDDYPTVSLDDLYSTALLNASYLADQPIANQGIRSLIATFSDNEATPVSFVGGNKVRQSKQRGTLAPINIYFNVWHNNHRYETGNIDISKKTYIITHGFRNTGGNPNNQFTPEPWIRDMANAIKDKDSDANVIVVDWEEGAPLRYVPGTIYGKAAKYTQVVGDEIAEYLINIGYNPRNVTLIGHSLGAQTSGDAGEWYQEKTGEKLGEIIALDAAGPLFEGEPDCMIVDSSDAHDVIGIHTSDVFGYDDPFANKDIYINPLRNRDLLGDVSYRHPGISSPITEHSYAIDILTRLLNKGDQGITDPNSKKNLNLTLPQAGNVLGSINNPNQYDDGLGIDKIWDFYETEFKVQLDHKTVFENSPNGTFIGKFSVKERRSQNDVYFELVNNTDGRFRIFNKNQLVVADGSKLDYESKTNHNIEVAAFDLRTHRPLSVSSIFRIQVIDVDETKLPEKPKIEIPIIRPSDPNDIVGPTGFGEEKWTSASSTLPYTIRFENQATATAPAQTVTVTHPLDTDLDFRTFRLSSFGWGGLIFDVPANTAFYNQRLDLTATRGYFVDVTAGIDLVKGEAFWTVTTIDPNTGEVTTDALTGFLPPNNADGIGDGFVNYTIKAKRDVPTGTVIDAKATIIFDTEAPIDTPPIFNTLDAGKPTSTVNALPTNVTNTEFVVNWTGNDGNNGSALANYTIYVSDNNGEFTPWLTDTTLTEATYIGQTGHTYAFYSIAKDNAGNTQTLPDTAQATIIVGTLNTAPTIISGLTANFAENGTGIAYTVAATDAEGTTPTYGLLNSDVDASLFNINSTTGAITFKTAPDFETPLDSGADNTYNLTVTANDGSLTSSKAVAITVTDLNEIQGNSSVNNGRNPIVGTAGPDYLTGGAGAKTLTGGGGNDSFVFTNMRDVGQRIADFTVGEDKLVFTQLFSSLGYKGSNPITDGYIKFVQGTGVNSAHTFLQIDRDGLIGSAIARNFLQVDNITPTQLNNINNFQF